MHQLLITVITAFCIGLVIFAGGIPPRDGSRPLADISNHNNTLKITCEGRFVLGGKALLTPCNMYLF